MNYRTCRKTKKTNGNDRTIKTRFSIQQTKNGKVPMPINPMMPGDYSMEVRKKLKDFERAIMAGAIK